MADTGSTFASLCCGCDRPVWEAHSSIHEHLSCEAAQQAAVRAAMEAEWANLPKRDGRMLRRNSGRCIKGAL